MTIAVVSAAPRPGLLYSLPAASQDTQVVRDALGNQHTSYAYQDGHSSAVAVSRSDVSKHLVYHQPQVVYQPQQVVYQHAPAPAYYETAHAPLVYQQEQYFHQAPTYFI